MSHQCATVLLIDDDKDMRWAMRTVLSDAGLGVVEAEAGVPGLEIAASRMPDAVLLDMLMPGLSGEDVLSRLHRLDPGLPIIIVTAHGTISGAVSAIRGGAFEYITKPFRNDHLVDTVQRAVARRSPAHAAPDAGVRTAITAMMGDGPSVQHLVGQIEAIVSTDYSVVIEGETGSGKEVVARCLHQHGRRARSPLVVIDCGAITETLTDSEFFGHEKGAYTGASERRRGYFEAAANGGTIFLDEIGNLAPTGQKALLRTLEERTIRRVGGGDVINLDVRVIAATNDDLRERARTGGFREDLFFRLAEYVITVPPLRSRPEDIEFLAQRFLTQARQVLGRPPVELSAATLDLLRAYRWPGNARELRNVMRRAALTRAPTIMPSDLGNAFCASPPPPAPDRATPDEAASLRHRVRGQVRAIERDAIIGALERARGNKAEAARLLGIDYKTYRTKLKLLSEQPEAVADVRR